MLETIALIIIAVLIFILIAVVAYIIYDYINYKQSVDNSISLSKDYINNNAESNTSNIVNYTTILDNKINNVSTTLSSTIGTNYNYTSNITSNLMYFDNALNKFFHFNEGYNNSPINKRLFEYNFTGINPSLDILNRVNSLGGMNIITTDKYLSSNNLRICDNGRAVGKNCINLNVATNGQFHITPENDVNSLIVNNVGNYPMAKFDYIMNDIYLGGDGSTNNPGSMKINGNNLYIKDINLISGGDNKLNNFTNTTLFNKDFVNNINQNILCDYFIKKTSPIEATTTETIIYTLEIKLMPYVDIPETTEITINIPELQNINTTSTNYTQSTIGNVKVSYKYSSSPSSIIIKVNTESVSNILTTTVCKSNLFILTNIKLTNTDNISSVSNKITMATATFPQTSYTRPTQGIARGNPNANITTTPIIQPTISTSSGGSGTAG